MPTVTQWIDIDKQAVADNKDEKLADVVLNCGICTPLVCVEFFDAGLKLVPRN